MGKREGRAPRSNWERIESHEEVAAVPPSPLGKQLGKK